MQVVQEHFVQYLCIVTYNTYARLIVSGIIVYSYTRKRKIASTYNIFLDYFVRDKHSIYDVRNGNPTLLNVIELSVSVVRK